MPWAAYHGPTSNRTDHVVELSGAGRAARKSDTLVTGVDALDVEVQFLTRPSASVVAWYVRRAVLSLLLSFPVDGDARRLSITGRFAAGVPVRVLMTWQVIGSRSIVAWLGESSWCL